MLETLDVGCHLSVAKGFANMARDAASINATTFQFFTRNPRGGKAKPIDSVDIAEFHHIARTAGIGMILAHAPYTVNPASPVERTSEFARMVLSEDLARMESVPCQLYNMHPGSAVGQTIEEAVDRIAAMINEVLRPEHTATILLETMSGKGTEVGGRFEDIAAIIERVELSDKVGVCLDTCHVWDAGYDIANDLDGVLGEFDRVIGLARLRAVHINDSKNPCGAQKDRHARIGEGRIGFEALYALMRHPSLRHLPFILETPNDSLQGYADEIARLRAPSAR